MKRRSGWLALALLLLCAFPTAIAASTEPTSGIPVVWKFAHEQDWLVDYIGRDLTEMLLFASHKTVSPVSVSSANNLQFNSAALDTGAGKYKFVISDSSLPKPLTYEFTMTSYAWSPTNYSQLAQQLIAELSLKPAEAAPLPTDFLKNLGDTTSASLFKENERVSKELTEHPLDPALHEQAALIQAAFDLHEMAGSFSDSRPPLCRIAAHLAVANALRQDQKPSIAGQLADIVLESLAGRGAIAVQKINAIEAAQTDPVAQSWLRALKIRSTGDFRLFTGKDFTALEEMQYGLQRGSRLGSDSIQNYIEQKSPVPKTSWLRIGLVSDISVGSGHVFAEYIVSAELNDFYNDYQLYNKQSINDWQSLPAQLNKTPTRCLVQKDSMPQLTALSWDDIAAFHARHLMHAFEEEWYFYKHQYGVSEYAKQAVLKAYGLLSEAKLFPALMCRMELSDQNKPIFLQRAIMLMATAPELVTCACWKGINWELSNMLPGVLVLQPGRWYLPIVPIGTGYSFGTRYDVLNEPPLTLQQLTELKAICPSDRSICSNWTKAKYGKSPSVAQLKTGYGPLGEFDLNCMYEIAMAAYNVPADYETEALKMARYKPSYYTTLGVYFARHNQPEKAIQYFEKGYKYSDDPVYTANESLWPINYWYDHGQKAKALALAKYSADVYSRRGLCSQAKLFERMGNLAGAERRFLDIKERYDADLDLCAFYKRNAANNKIYAAKLAGLSKKYFPQGWRKITADWQKTPPVFGVKIDDTEPSAAAIGVADDMVIVGLNGYLTENANQYKAVRYLPLQDQTLRLTIWDGKKYKNVAAQSVNDNAGFSIADYNPMGD